VLLPPLVDLLFSRSRLRTLLRLDLRRLRRGRYNIFIIVIVRFCDRRLTRFRDWRHLCESKADCQDG
jgi:hypothetical protein